MDFLNKERKKSIFYGNKDYFLQNLAHAVPFSFADRAPMAHLPLISQSVDGRCLYLLWIENLWCICPSMTQRHCAHEPENKKDAMAHVLTIQNTKNPKIWS